MPDAAVPALDARQLSRRLGDRQVLDDVSVGVGRGRIVTLAGPNGAGKSSLIRAIAGRLRLDRGEVRVDGRPLSDARRERRLGLVPQEIALYPHLTVRENLVVFGRLAGLSGATLATQVEDGLTTAGLVDRADALTRTLSGGMKRRVNLVAGTLHRPSLLLLDEPTVGVDAESEGRLHRRLRQLRDDGMGLLVATHNLEEAAAICDDIVVMVAGRVVASGTIEDIIAQVFRDGRELVLSVDAGTDAAAQQHLPARGFHRAGGHTWVRPAVDSLVTELGALEEECRAAGIRVAEASLRQPSLRGAIAVLTRPSSADAVESIGELVGETVA